MESHNAFGYTLIRYLFQNNNIENLIFFGATYLLSGVNPKKAIFIKPKLGYQFWSPFYGLADFQS